MMNDHLGWSPVDRDFAIAPLPHTPLNHRYYSDSDAEREGEEEGESDCGVDKNYSGNYCNHRDGSSSSSSGTNNRKKNLCCKSGGGRKVVDVSNAAFLLLPGYAIQSMSDFDEDDSDDALSSVEAMSDISPANAYLPPSSPLPAPPLTAIPPPPLAMLRSGREGPAAVMVPAEAPHCHEHHSCRHGQQQCVQTPYDHPAVLCFSTPESTVGAATAVHDIAMNPLQLIHSLHQHQKQQQEEEHGCTCPGVAAVAAVPGASKNKKKLRGDEKGQAKVAEGSCELHTPRTAHTSATRRVRRGSAMHLPTLSLHPVAVARGENGAQVSPRDHTNPLRDMKDTPTKRDRLVRQLRALDRASEESRRRYGDHQRTRHHSPHEQQQQEQRRRQLAATPPPTPFHAELRRTAPTKHPQKSASARNSPSTEAMPVQTTRMGAPFTAGVVPCITHAEASGRTVYTRTPIQQQQQQQRPALVSTHELALAKERGRQCVRAAAFAALHRLEGK